MRFKTIHNSRVWTCTGREFWGNARIKKLTLKMHALVKEQDRDVCNDQTVPNLQTTTYQARAYRDCALRLWQTHLAGLSPAFTELGMSEDSRNSIAAPQSAHFVTAGD